MPEIVEIKGVGPVLAKACIGNGYGSVEKIAAATVVDLVVVPGVSETKAEQLIGAAKSLLNCASSMNGSVPADAVLIVETAPVNVEKSAKQGDSGKKKTKKKNSDKKNKKSKSKKKSGKNNDEKKKKKSKKNKNEKKKKKSKKGK